jgi:hypothetical protein
VDHIIMQVVVLVVAQLVEHRELLAEVAVEQY